MATPRYFQPSLSDFWPGAEFYIAQASAKWVNVDMAPGGTITDVTEQQPLTSIKAIMQPEDFGQLFDGVRSNFYMRYLDMEQILEEGWRLEPNPPYEITYKHDAYRVDYYRHKNHPEYILSFVEEHSALGVYRWFDQGLGGTVIQCLIFSGTVKDINHFRKLIHMLDIETLDREFRQLEQNNQSF